MPTNFPTVDHNHHISKASKDLLTRFSPPSWEIDHRDGDNDYGIDLEVQVAPNGQVSLSFRAQLKGTASPTISSDGERLSIALQRTTLNLYASMLEPVMLIVSVVRFDANGKPDPNTSKVYWQWIDSELRRLRGSSYSIDDSSQESVTLHVPLANELTPLLDVAPYLEERLNDARLAEGLSDLVKSALAATAGRGGNPMQQLMSVISTDPSRIQALLSLDTSSAEDSDFHPTSEVETKIAEATTHIRAGKTNLAERLLKAVEGLPDALSTRARASLLLAKGKISMQRGRREDALTSFTAAYDIDPQEKYLLAKEETAFLRAIDKSDHKGIADVRGALEGVQTDEGLSLLLRILVSVSDWDAARKTIERITADKRLISTMILFSSEKRWLEVAQLANQALDGKEVSTQDAVAINLIAARAYWQLALATAAVPEGETELPLSGPPGINPIHARHTWTHAKACLLALRELSWTPNVELIAPIASASAIALGEESDAIQLLRVAASERQEYQELQESLEMLAMHADQYKVALEANTRQNKCGAVLVRRTCLYFQLKDFAACLANALEVATSVDPEVRQTPMAIAMGAASAHQLARFESNAKLIRVLRKTPFGVNTSILRNLVSSASRRKVEKSGLGHSEKG